MGLWEVGHYELVGSLMDLNTVAVLGLDNSCDILGLNFWEYSGKGSGCGLHHEVFESEGFISQLLNILSNCGNITFWAHIAVSNIPFLILHVCSNFTIAFSMNIVIPRLLEWVSGVTSCRLNFLSWRLRFLGHWLLLRLGRRLWWLSLSYLTYLYLILFYKVQNVPLLNISFRSRCWNFTGLDSVSSHIETGWWRNLI